MAYRAHVQVYSEDGRFGLTRLRSRFPGAWVGTRSGQPGIWVEKTSKIEFVDRVRSIRNSAEAAGYSVRVFTTNKPSAAALLDERIRAARG